MVKLYVQFRKKSFQVDIDDVEKTKLENVKVQLSLLTGLPPRYQKLLGFPGQSRAHDNATLASLGIKDGHRLMLIGSSPKGNVESFLQVRGVFQPSFKAASPNDDLLSSLPIELFTEIFTRLTLVEMTAALRVCKNWYNRGHDQMLWFHRFDTDFHPFVTPDTGWERGWYPEYVKKFKLEENWKSGRCRSGKILTQSSPLIFRYDPHQCMLYGLKEETAVGFVAEFSHNIGIYNIHDGALLRVIKGHSARITAMEHTSSLIVSGDARGSLFLWDLTRPPETLPWSKTSGEYLSHISDVHKGGISSLSIADNHLITAGADGDIKIWDLNESRLVNQFKNAPLAPPSPVQTQARAAPANNWAIANNGFVGFGGNVDMDEEEDEDRVNPSLSHRVTQVLRIDEHTYLSLTLNGLLRLWDTRTNKASLEQKFAVPLSWSQLLPNGNDLLLSSRNWNQIRTLDLRTFLTPIDSDFPDAIQASSVDRFLFDGTRLCTAGDAPRLIYPNWDRGQETFSTDLLSHGSTIAECMVMTETLLFNCRKNGTVISIQDFDIRD